MSLGFSLISLALGQRGRGEGDPGGLGMSHCYAAGG